MLVAQIAADTLQRAFARWRNDQADANFSRSLGTPPLALLCNPNAKGRNAKWYEAEPMMGTKEKQWLAERILALHYVGTDAGRLAIAWIACHTAGYQKARPSGMRCVPAASRSLPSTGEVLPTFWWEEWPSAQ